jgi:hypothetical protein
MPDRVLEMRVARAMWETHPNHGPWDGESLHAVPWLIYARAAIETITAHDTDAAPRNAEALRPGGPA